MTEPTTHANPGTDEPAPRYVEMALEVGFDDVDELGDALMAVGCLSVTVEDADADAPDEQPVYGEPGMEPTQVGWARNVLIALFDSEQAARDALAQVIGDYPELSAITPKLRGIEDQDWVALTQSQFEPFLIDGKLWVGPSWLKAPAGVPQLVLDPGSAFGTGSHPTTQLCLRWLMHELHNGETVLDYGCGTGVLALAALHAGAGNTDGTDIDPVAVKTACDNAQANGFSLGETGQVQFVMPDQVPADQRYDVVVANILARPLIALAPLLVERVRVGGRIILAGLLDRQADVVAAAYAPKVKLSVWAELDGWALLAGVRIAE